MGKQNFLFLIFCLTLTLGLMHSYHVFQEYFSPEKDDLRRISSLEQALQQKDLSLIVLQNQLEDFQQEVASALPALQKLEKDPKTFQLRTIASVTQKPVDGIELTGTLMDKARAEFRRGDFKAATRSFSKMTQKYPTSPLVVQAYFFWAESLFLQNRQQECLDVIDQMMTQFPDNELTGFIMLRMGQILQARNRNEEAVEVFQTVEKNFTGNHELKVQAEKLVKSVEI